MRVARLNRSAEEKALSVHRVAEAKLQEAKSRFQELTSLAESLQTQIKKAEQQLALHADEQKNAQFTLGITGESELSDAIESYDTARAAAAAAKAMQIAAGRRLQFIQRAAANAKQTELDATQKVAISTVTTESLKDNLQRADAELRDLRDSMPRAELVVQEAAAVVAQARAAVTAPSMLSPAEAAGIVSRIPAAATDALGLPRSATEPPARLRPSPMMPAGIIDLGGPADGATSGAPSGFPPLPRPQALRLIPDMHSKRVSPTPPVLPGFEVGVVKNCFCKDGAKKPPYDAIWYTRTKPSPPPKPPLPSYTFLAVKLASGAPCECTKPTCDNHVYLSDVTIATSGLTISDFKLGQEVTFKRQSLKIGKRAEATEVAIVVP